MTHRTRRYGYRSVALAAIVFSIIASCAPATTPQTLATNNTPPSISATRVRRVAEPVEGQYVVVLRPSADARSMAGGMVSSLGGSSRLTSVYTSGLRGFAVAGMSAAQAEALAADPRVAYVQQDGTLHVLDVQTSAPAHLDRIDQRFLPGDGLYHYTETGTGVNAYVIDTGIRATHAEFGGRATLDFTSITDGNGASDCHGHGTHVAGILGGSTYGVAKSVALHSVRVLDCSGFGTTSQVISGIDWVTAHAAHPAVANMSLGGPADSALDDAVAASVASGVVYAIAAGNNSGDACAGSPARTPEALTVAALDLASGRDTRASFSSLGSCVDLFAPGANVLSAWNTSDTATNTLSGTSMAAPIAAGIAALYLQGSPTATPATVAAALVAGSTGSHVDDAGQQSPSRTAYSRLSTPSGDTAPPTVSLTSPGSGANVSGTSVTLAASASDDNPAGVHHVEFYAGDEFAGHADASPFSFAWDSTAHPSGARQLTARAFDAAGNATTSSAVSVTLVNANEAAYDPTHQTPACLTTSPVSSGCDTTSLLDGRDHEPNAPNQLASYPCGDVGIAYYHIDQSVDRVRVRRLDGTSLATGKDVEIEVHVWSFGSFFPVTVTLTTTPDAPVWEQAFLLYPTASGAQVLTQHTVLPAGSLQAIRVAVDDTMGESYCSDADSEVDDLVFAVGPAESDTTSPVVSMTTPTAGATLSGVATLAVSASDNMGVTRVEYYDGASLIGTSYWAPFGGGWNTVGVSNGSHTLTARAYDYAGNSTPSAGVGVTVSNDTTPPTVSITSPAGGARVSGTVTVSASASDNVGVTQVVFYDGTTQIGSPDTTAPYSVSWNTAVIPTGSHTLKARAYDAAGNSTLSAGVTVTVRH